MKIKDSVFYNILFGFGVFLAVTEVCKQFLLYYVVNDRTLDWWYFPFQLCSLPMYMCLFLPWIPKRMKIISCTFMQDFNFLGGIAALIVSDGFTRGHWFLSLHAYTWHIILLFIGLFIAITGHSDNSLRGYLNTLPLFIISCVIATILNVLIPDSSADMFYISPYHANQQLPFRALIEKMNILSGHLLYLAAICVGAALLHLVFYKINQLASSLHSRKGQP